MIKFDADKLTVEHVKVKSVSQSLGGTLTVLDEEVFESTGKETFHRQPVMLSIARAFQAKYKSGKFLKPVEVALVRYEDQIVSVELRPLSDSEREVEGLFGTRSWTSISEYNIAKILRPLVSTGDWYIDGSFIYKLPFDLDKAKDEAKLLSSDGHFRTLRVEAWKLAKLNSSESDFIAVKSKKSIVTGFCKETRDVLIFVASTGQYAFAPPIWKELDNICQQRLKEDLRDDDEEVTFRFDAIDQYFAVNLNFALNVGKSLGETFGYETIEPLQLPQLMLALKTVNLPKVPPAVKATCSIGLQFTHGMAWLMGLMAKTTTFDEVIVVRNALKYLSSKGLFKKEMFDIKHVYKKDHDDGIVDLLSPDEALATADSKYNIDYLRAKINNKLRRQKPLGNVGGGLVAD